MKIYKMIWPEKRMISEDQIKIWYEDAVVNCEAEETELTDVDEMAKELNYIGNITLGS